MTRASASGKAVPQTHAKRIRARCRRHTTAPAMNVTVGPVASPGAMKCTAALREKESRRGHDAR